MTNKLKIDITHKEPVESVSSGKVTTVGWNPSAGASRQEQIAVARQEEFERHQEYLKSMTPAEQRLLKIEARLDALEAHAKE